jgi:hypothetical protein
MVEVGTVIYMSQEVLLYQPGPDICAKILNYR